jgi:ADP-heptose:LPS heptosyltransferase
VNDKSVGILLVRLDGIGDAALCVPSLEGLRQAYPRATFGAVCSTANAKLFSDLVSRVHVHDVRARHSSFEDVAREIAAAGYDMALIATEEPVGYALARAAGARRRAGFWHRWHKPFKSLWQRRQLTDPVYRPAARETSHAPEHEVEAIYRLARALGARDEPPNDPAALRPWLRREDSPARQTAADAVGFQITPKLLASGWSISAWADAIAEAARALPDRRVVFLAGPDGETLAHSLQQRLHGDLRVGRDIPVLSSLSLPAWLGVVDALAVLVTPDTGAAHVAGMLGGRVLDVFDEPNYETLSRQWHPWAGRWLCRAKPACTMTTQASDFGRRLAEDVLCLLQPGPVEAAQRPR